MRSALAAIMLIALSMSLPAAGAAQDGLLPHLQHLERLRDLVNVDADSIEYLAGQRALAARGNVRVEVADALVTADEVTVDLDDQSIVAAGNVTLIRGFDHLEGERVEYNYRTDQGVIYKGRGFLAPTVSFSGTEIRREGPRQYRVQDGRITTCRLCQPEPEPVDFEVRAGEATIYQDDLVVARDASLWVRGVPVLFAPVGALPIGPRRTGFLIPRFGYSNSNGFYLQQPFFWAISESMDATVTGIYRSRRGVELDGEYRYILDEASSGTLRGRYVYDTDPGADVQNNRGEVTWKHVQSLSPTWSAKADIQYQTDRFLQRAFIDTPTLQRTERTLPARLFATQMTSQYMVLGLVEVIRDLSVAEETRTARLPEIGFQWQPMQVGRLPLVVEGGTTLTYLSRNRGEDTGRFDILPSLSMPLPVTPWLMATTVGALRETAYTQSEQPGKSANRLLADIGEVVTARFARRFTSPGLGLLSLMHIVEPSVSYQYVPAVNQKNLPQFDTADFISPQNRLTYRLGNRLVARFQDEAGQLRSREVARFTVAQSANLQPRTFEFSNAYLSGLTPERVDQAVKEIQPLDSSFSRAQERTWSNLVFQAGFSPTSWLNLRGTYAWNTEQWRTEGLNATLELPSWRFLTLEAGYTFVKDREANGLVGRVEVRPLKGLSLDWLTRYEVTTAKFNENTITLRYGTCCWQISLRFRQLIQGPGQPYQNGFTINFDLISPSEAEARSRAQERDSLF
jgi:LPS-assembly protein